MDGTASYGVTLKHAANSPKQPLDCGYPQAADCEVCHGYVLELLFYSNHDCQTNMDSRAFLIAAAQDADDNGFKVRALRARHIENVSPNIQGDR